MMASLYVALCFAHWCVAKEVTQLPMKECASQMGQMLAYEYALKSGLRFKNWTCVPERRA